jgi:hypothetical protein
MKLRYSNLLFACSALILTACQHKAPEANKHEMLPLIRARAAHPSSLIELTGGHDSVCGQWRVVVSQRDGSLHVSRFSTTGNVTINPEVWRASKGAFVFVESDSRVWAYDGGADLLMFAASTEGLISYGPHGFPCELPEDVASRLPAEVGERIRGK